MHHRTSAPARRAHTRPRAVLVLLATLVALAAPAAQPATAAPDEPGGTVTWAVQPASAEGPDGRISLRHELDPGATVQDHVTVTNFSERPATFRVYAADGIVSASGDFDVPGVGAVQDGGGWVALGDVEGATRVDDALELTLEPGAAVTVPLTIAVPADARPGDHPAGVVAELVRGDDVRLAARVGARLHLRVTGEVEAALVPQDVVTRWEPSWNPFAPGTLHVSYQVANVGDVRLAARNVTTVAGPFGLAGAEHRSEVREVLPGQSAGVDAELSVWPLVRVTGLVETRPWVVGEDVVDAALRTGSAQVTVWAVPWAQLALLVLVVGGVLGVRWWRRRSAAAVQARIDAAVAAASARTPEPAASTSADGAHPASDG